MRGLHGSEKRVSCSAMLTLSTLTPCRQAFHGRPLWSVFRIQSATAANNCMAANSIWSSAIVAQRMIGALLLRCVKR